MLSLWPFSFVWFWLSLFLIDVFICGGYNGEVILGDIWKLNLQTFQWVKLPATTPEPVHFHGAAVTPAACMYIHGGVVNIHENKRTGSLFKIWLVVVPSLLELSWEKLLAASPNLANLPRTQLLHLGLTQGLIEGLKWGFLDCSLILEILKRLLYLWAV